MTDSFLVPDGITPVVGWRAYKVKGDTLRSTTRDVPWTPGTAHRAECLGSAASASAVWAVGLLGSPHEPRPNAHLVGLQTQYDEVKGTHFIKSGKVKIVTTRRTVPANLPAPVEGCTCGIYAAQSVEKVFPYIKEGGVVARIALWGKVVIYSEGWRAEYGYPQALYVKTPADEKVARAYGVPVLSWSNLPAHPETPKDPDLSWAYNSLLTPRWLSAQTFYGMPPPQLSGYATSLLVDTGTRERSIRESIRKMLIGDSKP